jgi:L-iditol 2-dehydrogenase
VRVGQVVGFRQLALLEVPTPQPQDGEVLVRLSALSICGSDMRYFANSEIRSYPLPLGLPTHECAGVVEESRIAGVRPGQPVIVLPTESRGLAEYVIAAAAQLVPLPNAADLATWVMCQHVGTVYYACSRLGSVAGKAAVVLGQGSIGLAFTRFLAGMAARDVIAVDLLASRLQFATRVGATFTVDASSSDAHEVVSARTAGEGADVVVEATGEPEAAEMAVRIARSLGTVVFFGNRGFDRIPFLFSVAYDKNLTCLFAASARVGMAQWSVARVVELAAQRRLDLAPLITHRFALESAQEAHELVADRRDGVVKAVLMV